MSLFLLTSLTFVVSAGLAFAIWWVLDSNLAVRSRLAADGTGRHQPEDASIVRSKDQERLPVLAGLLARLPGGKRLDTLMEQAGMPGRSGELFGLMILSALLGGVFGMGRFGEVFWGGICGAAAATVPVVLLRMRRQKRIEKFSEQFPEALDMIIRSLQAGYALGAAMQVIAEDMPEPVGKEFRRVFEEISLGRSPDEALLSLYRRVPTDDVRFFYTAVTIQREVGGNLAEILAKLSEVIRERFKLLSHARVLSAQHRASAYLVGASPVVLALLFAAMSPGYFEAMFRAPYTLLGLQLGKALVIIGLMLEGIGFLAIKRIAHIEV